MAERHSHRAEASAAADRLNGLTPIEAAFHAKDATNSLAFVRSPAISSPFGSSTNKKPVYSSPATENPRSSGSLQALVTDSNALSRAARSAYDDDSAGALSGYGYGHHGHNDYCPEGVPIEQALFAILAAFAASFGFLYRAITLITQGRRRKRSEQGPSSLAQTLTDQAADLYWWGRSELKKLIRERLTKFDLNLLSFNRENVFSLPSQPLWSTHFIVY